MADAALLLRLRVELDRLCGNLDEVGLGLAEFTAVLGFMEMRAMPRGGRRRAPARDGTKKVRGSRGAGLHKRGLAFTRPS